MQIPFKIPIIVLLLSLQIAGCKGEPQPKTVSTKSPEIQVCLPTNVKIELPKPLSKPPPQKEVKVNPFGIKNLENGQQWLGSIKNHKDYAEFTSTEYSVRAVTQILFTLQNKHNLKTFSSIFRKYVASNDIDEYLTKLSKDTDIKRNENIELFDKNGNIKDKDLLKKLIFAINICESGNKYKVTFDQIESGMNLYLKDFAKIKQPAISSAE